MDGGCFEIIHVPYKGPVQAVTDLLAGQVQMSFQNVGFVLPHIESGKLKALAIADEVRDLALPDVPTTIESGFPKLQATFWMGIVSPNGVPLGYQDAQHRDQCDHENQRGGSNSRQAQRKAETRFTRGLCGLLDELAGSQTAVYDVVKH